MATPSRLVQVLAFNVLSYQIITGHEVDTVVVAFDNQDEGIAMETQNI